MGKVWGVIPARFGSTRFPGKPLAMIMGKPLLQWVIEGAKQSKLIDKVLVATDDQRIAELAKQNNVAVAMTASDLPSGTDRIWAAIQKEEAEIVLNIQGDEPLINGFLIDSLIRPMLEDTQLEMATLAHDISLEELRSEHAVKVITNTTSDAIYFSRFAVPYSRVKPSDNCSAVLKHIGMYAYRKQFLKRFCNAPVAEIEKAEALEQLRALYLGAKIRVIKTEQRSWGVDTPEDVEKIEKLFKK